MAISDQDRAERSIAAMMAGDGAARLLGMELVEARVGGATLAMTITGDHTNGHGTCHGGMIFALAGSAFACACNSYNQAAVAQTSNISYVAPARIGDRLTADARETARGGRSGIYDVTVRNQDNRVVALFRGGSRLIGGTHFDEAAPA